MKKALLLIFALALVFSLVACGGNGNDDPLNRPGNTSGTNSTDPTGNNPGDIPNLADAIGGTGKLSDLDAATRQAMIDAAKADGVDIDFKADGSVVITEADGSKSVQDPDGSWTFYDADGKKENIQVGGNWPDNEFTRLLPKPSFDLMGASTDDDRFAVAFQGATVDQVKAYVEQVKAKGFTVDAETTDENFGGMAVYIYSASNADGYKVEVSCASGVTGLSIEKF